MPMWRCPHCGTPQAETSRCWVCKRSSTSCGTCRHFRRSIAGQLGYCGLDPHRRPLRGDELRGCWEEAPSQPSPGEAASSPAARLGGGQAADGMAGGLRRLEFVPIGEPPVDRSVVDRPVVDPAPVTPVVVARTEPDPILGLWGEER